MSLFQKTLAIIFIPLCISACGESQNQTEQTPETTQNKTQSPPPSENTAEMIKGSLKVSIGDDVFEVDQFQKEVSNLSIMEAVNGIDIINLVINIDEKRRVIFNVPSGKEDIGDSVQNLSTEIGQISFFSFFEGENDEDHIMLSTGEASIKNLDLRTGQIEVAFEGEGGNLNDTNKENNVAIKGSISLKAPKVNDYRTKK